MKARFDELRDKPYNSEAAEPGPDGQPPARLTLGLESVDGMSAADILHVRQGENYLVTDFTRSERLRDDPAVMDILAQVSREIGFDRVHVWEQAEGGRQTMSIVPFAEWDDPYFTANTPGRIAALYYELLHRCDPLPEDRELHKGQVAEIVQFIQQGGKYSISQLSLAVSTLWAGHPNDTVVQELASTLKTELSNYSAPEQDTVQHQKPKHKKSLER